MKISPVNFNTFNCKKPNNNVKFGTMTPEAEALAKKYRPSYYEPEEYDVFMKAAKDFPKDFAHFYVASDGHMYCDTKTPEEKRDMVLYDELLEKAEIRFAPVVKSFVELQDELAGKPKPKIPQYVGAPSKPRESVWIGDVIAGKALFDPDVPWDN